MTLTKRNRLYAERRLFKRAVHPMPGEIIKLWSPTCMRLRPSDVARYRSGRGYMRLAHMRHQIATVIGLNDSLTWVFVMADSRFGWVRQTDVLALVGDKDE